MMWTLWIILVVLCGIYENLIEMSDKISIAIVVSLFISGFVLLKDYLNKE